jgi:CheY-specific phosphatase CheX
VELHEIQPFIDATRHVFRTLMLLESEPGGDGAAGLDSPVIRASIEVFGDRTGSIGLVLPLETARRLNAMLTGTPGGGDTSEVCDAAAELTDLIAAGGVARFLGLEIRLGCARASLRAVAAAFAGADGPVTRIPFVCENGGFDLEIGLAEAPVMAGEAHGSSER